MRQPPVFPPVSQFIHVAVLLCMLCVPGSAAAQDESSPPQILSDDPIITPEEIIVTAQRPMRLLRNELKFARSEFFLRYNELNLNDEFDVSCRKTDWTHTRIQDEICLPRFFDEAVAEEARQAYILQDFNVSNMSQLATQYARRFDELSGNILAVARAHPQVAESLMELGKLEAAIKAKREECEAEPAFQFLFFRLCQ